jgi:hypothetical protein
LTLTIPRISILVLVSAVKESSSVSVDQLKTKHNETQSNLTPTNFWTQDYWIKLWRPTIKNNFQTLILTHLHIRLHRHRYQHNHLTVQSANSVSQSSTS